MGNFKKSIIHFVVEATRSGILIWDALALKGNCHLWIDGENETGSDNSQRFIMWDSEEAPSVGAGVETKYYLLCDCPGIGENAKAGQIWQYVKVTGGLGDSYEWVQFNGELSMG